MLGIKLLFVSSTLSSGIVKSRNFFLELAKSGGYPWPRSLVDYSLDFENCREYLCGFDSLRVFKSFAFTTTVSANCMKNTLSAISRICETYI